MSAWASNPSILRSQWTWLPKAYGHAVGDHLGHTPEGVPVPGGRLDRLDHLGLGIRVEAADRGQVDRLEVPRPGPPPRLGQRRPHLDHVANDLHAQFAEQQLAHRAGGHPGRRLPGAGPLQHVTRLGQGVLLHPGQVGVAGAGLGEGLGRLARGRRHLLGPLGPLGVGYLDGHRRAQGTAVPHPAQQGELVGLEAHAGPAAVPEAPAGQLVGDVPGLDRQPGRKALHDDHQALAVRLAGGEKTKHDRRY